MKRILIVVGHPDPGSERLCRALAGAYAEGARSAGHDVREIDLAAIDVPLLRSAEEFEHGPVPASLAAAVASIEWAQHLVFVFPLWLGTMPALMKAFLEQVMRPGVAFDYPQEGATMTKARLKGRSARVVVTMGMPALFYRLWFLGHGIAGLRRNILNFVGIRPVSETILGLAGAREKTRNQWLARMRSLGASGA